MKTPDLDIVKCQICKDNLTRGERNFYYHNSRRREQGLAPLCYWCSEIEFKTKKLIRKI
jgi:hypothetical protein